MELSGADGLSAVHFCPSDSWSSIFDPSPNYYINDGTRFRIHPHDGFANGRGFVSRRSFLDTRPRDVTDGLSHTATFSERLRSEGGESLSETELRADGERFVWYTAAKNPNPSLEEAVAADCRAPATPYPYSFNPANTGYGYDHRLPPNSLACALGPPPAQPNFLVFTYAFITANSRHPGHVQVLMADGAVRPVSEHVDGDVWMSIGTRSGGEQGRLP